MFLVGLQATMMKKSKDKNKVRRRDTAPDLAFGERQGSQGAVSLSLGSSSDQPT